MAATSLVRYRPRVLGDLTDVGARRVVYAALCLLWFTIPWQGVIRFGGNSTVTKAVGVVVAVLALTAILMAGRRVRLNDAMILMIVFACWVALSLFWTVTPGASGNRVVTMVQLLLLVLITWEFAHSRAKVVGLMHAWIAGCLVVGGFIVVAWALGVSQTRYTAPGTDPGTQAFSLLIAVPMAWYLSLRSSSRWLIIAYRVFVPFAIFAVILTASRAALLISVVALAIVPLSVRFMSGPGRLVVAAATTVCVAIALALVASNSGPIARLSTTSTELSSGTLDHRTTLWSIALRIIAQHPLLGVGTGGSRAAVAGQFFEGAVVHDTYLSIGSELGAIGAAIFLLLLLAAAYRATTRTAGLERRFAWVLTVTLVCALLPRADDYDKRTYAVIVLLALLGSIFGRPPGRVVTERARTETRDAQLPGEPAATGSGA